MANVFIIHGWGADPSSNWFPWLKQELEQKGYEVFVPAFPDSDFPNLKKWMGHFKKYSKHITQDTILVGHSLGPAFIFHVLQELEHPIKAVFLVAPFTGRIGDEFDKYISDISIREFNWDKIKKNCRKFVLFASDNDPYVPLKKVEELQKLLPNAQLTVIKGAEHLNSGSGYFTFNELRDAILECAQ